MTADSPVQGWADPVAAFLRANIPRDNGPSAPDSRRGWDHKFSTAYQIGCMALIALGEATEESWGATPRIPPNRPAVLPRWDDVAVAVLWLAAQQNQFQWRMPDGTVPPTRSGQYIIKMMNAPPPPPPAIAATNGYPPVHASHEVMKVLSALGLLADGAWTNAAELVLWRCGQGVAVETDPRFAAAVETCIATMPPDISASLSSLANIPATEVTAELERSNAQPPEQAMGRLSQFRLPPPTEVGIRRALAFWRGCEADRLFFRRWRLPDGWLTPDQAGRALEVFHDPVAEVMRHHVVEWMLPGSDLAIAEPPNKSPA
jgi:hypothetical protein